MPSALFKLSSILLTFAAIFAFVVTPTFAKNNTNVRPGWGFGDKNHIHLGPPGQSVVAGANVVISGNGAGSTNTVVISKNKTTNVYQSNSSGITNALSNSSKTGGNKANGNTGGNVSIVTGASGVFVSITNFLNSNIFGH